MASEAAQEQSAWYKGVTRYQWLVLTVAWLGWVFDIFDTALFNFTKIPMLTEMLGKAEYDRIGKVVESDIMMVFFLGWALGGLIFGILADKWGRTRTLVVTILLYSALTALTAFAQTVPQVMVMRFLTALGIGGEWAAGAALIAEVFPNKARAPAASVLQSAAAVGPILAAFANIQMAALSWRYMFVLGALPALITVVIRLYVREPERSKAAEKRSDAGSLSALFGNEKWRRHAIVATVIGIVGIAGATNLSFWMPNLVKEASVGLTDIGIRERTSYVTYAQHVGTILGVILFPWLCNRIGRRPAFALFFVMSPISVAIATWGGTSYETLLFAAPLMSFFVIGLTAGFALYFPELFPTHLRATGAGMAYNTGRVATAFVPPLTGRLMLALGNSVPQGVLGAAMFYVIGLLALPLAPETRGKPLPESDISSAGSSEAGPEPPG